MTARGIYLKRGDTRQLVEANLLDELTDHHLALWKSTWAPVMQAHCAQRSLTNRPQDHHWDWQWKADQWRPLLGYHSFVVVCQSELQGLMLASDFKSARIQTQFGKPLVYPEFLATAPWNRGEVQQPPRYLGVGTVMMGAAIELSVELGYRGRLGLHSLPAAERFYREACGMTELGQDAAHEDLVYFEMTEKQAEAFRQTP